MLLLLLSLLVLVVWRRLFLCLLDGSPSLSSVPASVMILAVSSTAAASLFVNVSSVVLDVDETTMPLVLVPDDDDGRR